MIAKHLNRSIANRSVTIFLLTIILSGCSAFSELFSRNHSDAQVATIIDALADADRKEVDKEVGKATLSSVSTEEAPLLLSDMINAESIADVYSDALALLDDPVAKNAILQRLAALELKSAENLDLVAGITESEEAYSTAIQAYQTLLSDPTQTEDRDELHYSLAKAYALKGESRQSFEQMTLLVHEYPNSTFWQEAQFRRGEHLFVQGEYKKSAVAFRTLLANLADPTTSSDVQLVVNSDTSDLTEQGGAFAELHTNSLYMLGWSEFKSSRYEQAIESFVTLIDEQYAYQDDFATLLAREEVLGNTAFTTGHKLVDDAVRGIVLALSYSPVPDAKASLAAHISTRVFAHRVYSQLAEHFYQQRRHVDAASIYAAYQTAVPQSQIAPWFFNQQILLLQHAKYAEQALEQKAAFAKLYHPTGSYYSGQQEIDTRVYIDSRIGQYLDELSSFHHARARARKETDVTGSQEDFAEAVFWYEQEIAAFPHSDTLGSTYFLLGECLSESERLPEAIDAFEMAAYGEFNYDKKADAGYAALVTYNDNISSKEQAVDAEANNSIVDEQSDVVSLAEWRYKKVASALLFADTFKFDERRDSVLANTINDLQQLEDWPEVIVAADILLLPVNENTLAEPNPAGDINVYQNHRSDLTAELSKTAWLASAEAAYQLDDFAQAEARYYQALGLMTENNGKTVSPQYAQSEEYNTVLNNYANAIYRQAEQSYDSGDYDQAILLFDRIVERAPAAAIRPAAQADTIGLLAKTEQWQALTKSIPVYLSDYPESDNKLEMRRQLIDAHAQLEQWQIASELSTSLADDIDKSRINIEPGQKGSATLDLRLAAAAYSLSSNNKSFAIAQHLTLLENYKEIDERRYETHNTLMQLYQQTDNKQQLERQYQTVSRLGAADSQLSDRSAFIVAFAEDKLAEKQATAFFGLSITQPLAQSLRKKRDAMEVSINAYNKVEQYGVEEFATRATEQKAKIYASFASAIMKSERPAGLDELASEEYEFLLEEQAYPFEEQAIELHEVNVKRAWSGTATDAIKQSYRALAELMPARYNKLEKLD